MLFVALQLMAIVNHWAAAIVASAVVAAAATTTTTTAAAVVLLYGNTNTTGNAHTVTTGADARGVTLHNRLPRKQEKTGTLIIN